MKKSPWLGIIVNAEIEKLPNVRTGGRTHPVVSLALAGGGEQVPVNTDLPRAMSPGTTCPGFSL